MNLVSLEVKEIKRREITTIGASSYVEGTRTDRTLMEYYVYQFL